MKKIFKFLQTIAMAVVFSGCTSVDLKTDMLSKKMNAVNSLDTALPQTEVAQSIMRFLKSPDNGKAKKVLVIGYDGVRLDAVVQAETPAVDSNAGDTGFFVLFTGGIKGEKSEQFTLSGPGWTTTLTGVWADEHEFTSNYNKRKSDTAPSFLLQAERLHSDLQTCSLVNWDTINTHILSDELDRLDDHFEGATDDEVIEKAIEKISADETDIIFIAFDDTDHAGHAYGFSPLVPEYIHQIEKTDSSITALIHAVHARPDYSKEDWLILITTDHGGNGTRHGGQTNQERIIWMSINQPQWVIH